MHATADTTAMSTSSPDRRATDRRRRATPILSRYTFFGGRRAGERRGGGEGQYVDRYSPRLAAALVAIAVLCAVDAVFTLLYIAKDGKEANPVMRALIDATQPRSFLVVKCLVTNLGLAVLCLHKNFRFVRPMIGMLLFIYSALFMYHIYLAATAA